MIESVHFQNFKVLRDATLPLGHFTLIVGPNGSGKTTALQALEAMRQPQTMDFHRILTLGTHRSRQAVVCVTVHWARPTKATVSWSNEGFGHLSIEGVGLSNKEKTQLQKIVNTLQVFALDANAIAQNVELEPRMTLASNGAGLAGVLDRLRDQHTDRFDALNGNLGHWLPEFDRVLFDTPGTGTRAFQLRTREGHHTISASELSQGTLLALAILTLAYLPDVPPVVCFEEPDRGIHPRLLRDVRDALYRLSYPENFGEKRDPVQVIATTHSPYFLDLFSDHPEEVVIAHKEGQEARFERLSDQPNIDEILQDSHLGDAWYTGILGGVPCEQ